MSMLCERAARLVLMPQRDEGDDEQAHARPRRRPTINVFEPSPEGGELEGQRFPAARAVHVQEVVAGRDGFERLSLLGTQYQPAEHGVPDRRNACARHVRRRRW